MCKSPLRFYCHCSNRACFVSDRTALLCWSFRTSALPLSTATSLIFSYTAETWNPTRTTKRRESPWVSPTPRSPSWRNLNFARPWEPEGYNATKEGVLFFLWLLLLAGDLWRKIWAWMFTFFFFLNACPMTWLSAHKMHLNEIVWSH